MYIQHFVLVLISHHAQIHIFIKLRIASHISYFDLQYGIFFTACGFPVAINSV
jgi:hypothetical protein